MKLPKNISLYITGATIFILMKIAYRQAETNDLTFLLSPTSQLVGIVTGSKPVHQAESGYYFESLHIFIDKSCSGFNFWALSFFLFLYLAVKHFNKISNKILSIPIALITAYLLTVLVNSSRIFVSIIVQSRTKNIITTQQHLLHEGIGIITNLTFLILTYIIIEKTLTHKRPNAKLT